MYIRKSFGFILRLCTHICSIPQRLKPDFTHRKFYIEKFLKRLYIQICIFYIIYLCMMQYCRTVKTEKCYRFANIYRDFLLLNFPIHPIWYIVYIVQKIQFAEVYSKRFRTTYSRSIYIYIQYVYLRRYYLLKIKTHQFALLQTYYFPRKKQIFLLST